MELAAKETIFKSHYCFSGACVHYAHIFHAHQTITMSPVMCSFPICTSNKDLMFQCALFWLNLTRAKHSGSFTTIFNGSSGNQT